MSALPPKATLGERIGISALCQKQTHAPQQSNRLFDHFVGKQLDRVGHLDPESLGRLRVDEELELG